MKKQTILIAIAAMLFAACKNPITGDNITGTYVNEATGDYSIAYDTLRIEPAGEKQYTILRRTGYRPIRNGHLLPKRFKVQIATGIYDPQSLQMNEAISGKVYHFQPDKHLLKLNQAVYHKIN